MHPINKKPNIHCTSTILIQTSCHAPSCLQIARLTIEFTKILSDQIRKMYVNILGLTPKRYSSMVRRTVLLVQ